MRRVINEVVMGGDDGDSPKRAHQQRVGRWYVINTGVRFRKRGETIDLGGWAGSACLSAVLARGWGIRAGREEGVVQRPVSRRESES